MVSKIKSEMTDLGLKVNEQTGVPDNKVIDGLFFKIYDEYSAIIYREILTWVEDKSLAREILFRSFMQMHRQFPEMPETPSSQLAWMLNISQTVYAGYTEQLYGELRCG